MLFNSIPRNTFNIHIGAGVIYLQIYRARVHDYRVTMLIRVGPSWRERINAKQSASAEQFFRAR
jgi:hypothetical protein